MEVTKDKQTFMCEICDKLLSSSASRKRHLKCVHGLKLPPVISNSDNNKTCDLCNKTFSSKFAKERHTSEVHDSMRTECSKPTAVQCKECGVNFSRLSIYRQHLQQFHNIETTTAQYEFASEEEFMAWKDALEMEVGVNYTSHTGNKKSVDSTKTIYYCRRSGVQKSSKSTHKRAEKSQGTSKMGYYCTSSIEAVRQNGCVQVTYYVEHHEHDINFHSLVHMTLPASVKDKIAAASMFGASSLRMILRGVSHEHILEQVRKSAGESRAAILESQDIKNIVTQFGLKQEHKRHPDDSTSVRLIVTEYREAGDLLYFKDQNSIDPENPEIGKKEFVLGFIKEEQRRVFSKQLESGQELQICMDSTHCISQYEGYQLTTLMTVTDLNQGFPVAFLISSTVNEAILKVFLGEVKKRLGSLCAKIFMSDDDPMFRNAWNAIMHGDVPQQVLYLNCSWHTDRTFRRNIGSKIKAPLHQKKEIYQMVRALMDEPEEDEFHKKCKGFLMHLSKANYQQFLTYFNENYLDENRIKLWPKCFRKDVTLHTNNFLESMHRLLKYVYMNGKKVKRLDYTLYVLGKLVNDVTYKRMIDLMKNRTRRHELNERHRDSKNLDVVEDDGHFLVSSASIKQKKYTVITRDLSCNICRERCTYCNVCQCMYMCTCGDNDKGTRNICKHIHAVVQHMEGKTQVAMPNSPSEEIEYIQDIVCNKLSTDSQPQNYGEQLIKYIHSNLLPQCKEISDQEAFKAAGDHIRKAVAILSAAKNLASSNCMLPVDLATKKEPANKHCDKQQKLYSTKRKRVDTGQGLTKPSKEMRQKIGERLSDLSQMPVPMNSPPGDSQY